MSLQAKRVDVGEDQLGRGTREPCLAQDQMNERYEARLSVGRKDEAWQWSRRTRREDNDKRPKMGEIFLLEIDDPCSRRFCADGDIDSLPRSCCSRSRPLSRPSFGPHGLVSQLRKPKHTRRSTESVLRQSRSPAPSLSSTFDQNPVFL